jgi:hypothetical protein
MSLVGNDIRSGPLNRPGMISMELEGTLGGIIPSRGIRRYFSILCCNSNINSMHFVVGWITCFVFLIESK